MRPSDPPVRHSRRRFLALGAAGLIAAPAWAQDKRRRPTPPSSAGLFDLPERGPVSRFVVLGDQGEGNLTQVQVAGAIDTVAVQRGCDFALLLGDNFYDCGVASVNDPQFQTKFEQPYARLDFPFYPVLGNHDLSCGAPPWDLDKGDHQVDYTALSSRWTMPAQHYRFGTDTLFLVGLNTPRVLLDDDADQRADVAGWMSEAAGRWKIAFGHHEYISNGPHGNAGAYEGLPPAAGPVATGAHVQSFLEDLVCGQFDLYLAGNDHSLQDLVSVCGTEHVISGAGSKTTTLVGSNASHFEAAVPGFVHVTARTSRLTLRFFDEHATLLHTRCITR